MASEAKAVYLHEAIRSLEVEQSHVRSKMLGKAQWLIDDLQDVIDRLETGRDNVNELGVLQGKAVDFDILCSRYETIKRHLALLRAVNE